MYSFEEGDLVHVTKLQEEAKQTLSKALGVPFRSIKFYFIEHETDDMVVLSAESDKKFAIVNCPVHALENHQYVEEIDALLNHLLLEGSLARKDKTLFMEVTNRMKHASDAEFSIGLIDGE